MRKKLSAILIIGALILVAGRLALVHAQAPNAAFSFSPANPDINTEVTFDASNSGSAISQYEWDFNGDGKYDLVTTSPKITHLFDDSGKPSVTLRVTDQHGGHQTIAQTISVSTSSVRIRRQITAPINPDRVSAGSAFQVTITVNFLQSVTAPGINETVPSGWRISSVQQGNALYKSSENAWLMTSIVDPGTTWQIVYDVTVPSGTPSATYSITGLFSSRSVTHPIQIQIPGDNKIRVI
jgi:PKD repeat protein